MCSSNSTSVYLSKENENTYSKINSSLFTAALLTIAKIWKQPKCPSIDEDVVCINMCVCVCVCNTHTHIYIMEYYSAIKNNEILPSATTWMDLEGIMLSDISQIESQIPYDFTYLWNLKKQNK